MLWCMLRRDLLKFAITPAFTGASALALDSPTMHVSTLLEQDPATSIAEQVMGEAYHRLGLQLEVHRLPGERSLLSANTGKMDGELYRKVGMEKVYPNLMIVPVPLLTYEIVVFTRGTTFVVNGWESLRPFTIGFVRGIKIVEQNTQGMKIEPVLTMQQAFQKMELGRTDVVVANRASGLAVIKALQLEGIGILTPPLVSFPVYHYLHQKHAALAPRLTTVLQKMHKDMTIEKIQKAVMATQ